MIFAEVVYVLESLYELEREQVAECLRAVIGFPAVIVLDASLLLRALEVYELHRIDCAEAYLAACAEASRIGAVASFDRGSNASQPSNASSPALERLRVDAGRHARRARP